MGVFTSTRFPFMHPCAGPIRVKSTHFLLYGDFWEQEVERYEPTMPTGSHLVGSKGHMYVRVFKTPEEAVVFSGNENASPLRMHLMSSTRQGIFKSKSVGQLGSGGSIMS